MTTTMKQPAGRRSCARSQPRTAPRRNVAGQALVMFVVFIGVLALGLILLFNTGQAVNKKVRLTHAADAAAYSVAVQQARAMNFTAYMNRGRIANEVAIAQAVSLWSWMNMIHAHTVEGANIFTLFSWVPGVAVLARIYSAAERVVAIGRGAANPILQGIVTVADGINEVLSRAATAMMRLGGGATALDIAHTVVERNDPAARIPMLAKALLAEQLAGAASLGNNRRSRYIQAYDTLGQRNDGMDRYRNVVMASRDEFSANREDDLGVPGLPIDLEAAGGTDMVDYKRWVAMDTLDISIGIDMFGIDLTVDLPLGWGGAQAVKRVEGNGQAFYPGIRSGRPDRQGNGWYAEYHDRNPTYAQYGGVSQRNVSGNMAGQYPSVDAPFYVPLRPTGNLNRRRDAYLTGYDGLRRYDDVRPDRAKRPTTDRDGGPVFSVYVVSDRADARTAQDIDGLGGRNGGQLQLDAAMRNDEISAIASSQVYFNRAPSYQLFQRLVPKGWNARPTADNQLEHGSLFSPYWQARLVDTPGDVYLAVGAASLAGL